MIQLKNIFKTYHEQNAREAQQLKLTTEQLAECAQQEPTAWALRGLNLQVNKGEIFAVIGKSGAGKSTLLRLINQLEKQTHGEVIVHDQRLQTLSAPKLRNARRQIAMIFQHFNLLDVYTVFDNVALALAVTQLPQQEQRARVEQALQLVGLADKALAYPDQLSGGQKQRVAIARALVTRPSILLCDEATSALDTESTQQILQLLSKIRQQLGVTIFLITHELDVVRRICDRVAVIDQGQIVEQGATLDVLLHPQHAVSKRLVAHTLEQQAADALSDYPAQVAAETTSGVPDNAQQQTHTVATASAELVRLVYVGKETDRALLSDIQRLFGVATNILQAKIEHISGARVGYMLCQLLGDLPARTRAKEFLAKHGVEINPLNEGEQTC